MATVLIVEDQDLIAAEMQTILEKAGHDVIGLASITKSRSQ